MARRKLLRQVPQPFTLWGHTIAVDWAEPELEVDEDIMEQVKILYVRNLHIDTQESTIAEVFQQLAPVERVKKIRDYAFVHFTTKEDARKAKRAMDGKEIDGCVVEVTLAKPVDRETYARHTRHKLMMNTNATIATTLAPTAINPYAPYGIPTLYQQFVMPGVNTAMSASGLPAPAAGTGQGLRGRPLRGAAGSRGARANYAAGANPGAPHNSRIPYGLERMFDFLPGMMELTPATPTYTMKPPDSNKSPIQVDNFAGNMYQIQEPTESENTGP
eukprot:sb/3468087/